MASKPAQPAAVVVDALKASIALAYLRGIREELIALHGEDIADDTTLMADMLDGEGANAMDVLRALLEAAENAEWMAESIKERRAILQDRQERFAVKAEKLQGFVASALRTLGIDRLDTPVATLTLRKGAQRLEIESEDLVPRRFYVAQEPKLDRKGLLDFLKSGAALAGVSIGTGPDTHQVRRA